DGVLTTWDAVTGESLRRLPLVEGKDLWAAFSADGQRLVADPDPGVLVWETSSGRRLLAIDEASGPLAISPDGRRIAGLLDPAEGVRGAHVHSWDVETGRQLFDFEAVSIEALAYSRDGRTLVCSSGIGREEEWLVRVRDAGTGEELPVPSPGRTQYVDGFA